MNKRGNIWQISAIGLLAITILLVLPFLSNFSLSAFSYFSNNTNLFADTLVRSVSYAFISGIVLVVFGFIGAILLVDVPFFSKLGKTLSLLILPISLGNIAIAFIFKLVLGETRFFADVLSSGIAYKLFFLLLLQVWQYGFLFTYLYWLQFQGIPSVKLEYAKANRFSFFHSVKDIYLPHTRNLWILLVAIGVVFSMYEESKIQYLLKASQGTNSELITTWLGRNYQTNLLVNPQFAAETAFQSGGIVFLCAIGVLAVTYLLINFVFKGNALIKIYPSYKGVRENSLFFGLQKFWAILILVIIACPIVLCLLKVNYAFSSSTFALGFPLLMTLIATSTATVISILFGISARLGWQNLLSSFNNRSLFFFIALFVLLLIPPILILISGYRWMGLLGYSSTTMIYIVWVLGHTVLALPLLGSFVLFNHFRVSTNELNYLSVYQLPKRELIKYSFLSRFKAEYFLLFIIGYSFIWNEAVLNNLFSDYIPSFVSGLKMLITGRGADYTKAFGYLLVSLGIAIGAVVVWRQIINKAEQWITK